MISASDVCVNLRYPSMGESSATLAMIMAMGRPALVTPVGQFKEFPDDLCGKIPLGAGEKAALVRQFEEFQENPETGRRMGDKARAFVEDRGWPDVARRYFSCLEKAASEEAAFFLFLPKFEWPKKPNFFLQRRNQAGTLKRTMAR